MLNSVPSASLGFRTSLETTRNSIASSSTFDWIADHALGVFAYLICAVVVALSVAQVGGEPWVWGVYVLVVLVSLFALLHWPKTK